MSNFYYTKVYVYTKHTQQIFNKIPMSTVCVCTSSNWDLEKVLLNLLLKLLILSARGSGQNDNWMIKLILTSVLFASGQGCPISISFSIHPISLHL